MAIKLFTKPFATVVLAATLALGAGLAGCVGGQGSSSEDPAAKNRAYMASLNRDMADLGEQLEAFQDALAQNDAVTMKAKLAAAERIVEGISSTEAPERLAELKDSYSAALEQLQSCLQDYTNLYAQLDAKALSATDYEAKLAELQVAYDEAVELLRAADERAVEISKE